MQQKEKELKETLENVARKMLEFKRPVEEIADVTGLTKAQVRKLKKNKSG